MKKLINKFLEFNGKAISFLSVDGQWWVAIKPICDVLDVEYTRQFKNLKADKILDQLLAEQPMVGADGRLRKMICLPEKFIYGWLFSINSESEGLLEFKRECYEVLFDHFHGGIRTEVFKKIAKNSVEIKKLQKQLDKELVSNETDQEIKSLTSANIILGKKLAQIEKDERAGIMDLFQED
jgi:prophage antirepressor-like protein